MKRIMKITRESNEQDLDRLVITVSHKGMKYNLSEYDGDVTLQDLTEAVERLSEKPPSLAIGMYWEDET